MKKRIIFLYLLISGTFILNAQITITGNDLPQSGRVNLLVHDTLTQVDIGTAGSTAQTWNFTTVNSSYPQVTSYSATTPYHQYASVFPDANIYSYGPSLLYGALMGVAPVDYTNFGYMYLQSDVNGLNIIGYKSQYGITHQVPKDKVLITPAQLNDSFNDSSYWEVAFDTVPTDIDTVYRSRAKKTVTVDAFGSLTTVLGTFDVLRVHEYFIKTDSIFGILNGNVVFSMEALRDTVNNYHFWTNGLEYPVAIVKTRTNGQILITEVIFDTVPSYQITGTVYNTDGSAVVQAGRAQLVPKDQIDNLFGVQEEVQIDNNGHFQFSNVLQFGNFMIIAIPDAVQYPDLIPTYYGDEIYWPDALPMQASSDTTVNIYCRNNTIWQSYPGNGNTITGIVWNNTNSSKGPGNSTPSRGIRVTLEKNPGGAVVRHTETDVNGRYTFEDLPSFEYSIVVDIPAIGMDSTYHFNLTTSNDQTYDGYDFVYDTTKIYIYDATGTRPDAHTQTIELNVYPNPLSTKAYIKIVNSSYSEIEYAFEIYDVAGKRVKSFSGNTTEGFEITSEGIENGIYLYKLSLNNSQTATGKLIIRK